MDTMFRVSPTIQIPDDELKFSYARSSGPGGQNVNKVNSKATLKWAVAASAALNDEVRQRLLAQQARRITTEGEIVLSSERYRDQRRNVEDCLEKLREIVMTAAVRPKRRRATRPTKASKERRLKYKAERSSKKESRRKIDSRDG